MKTPATKPEHIAGMLTACWNHMEAGGFEEWTTPEFLGDPDFVWLANETQIVENRGTELLVRDKSGREFIVRVTRARKRRQP